MLKTRVDHGKIGQLNKSIEGGRDRSEHQFQGYHLLGKTRIVGELKKMVREKSGKICTDSFDGDRFRSFGHVERKDDNE